MNYKLEKRLTRATAAPSSGTETTTLLGKKGEVSATKKQIDAAFKRICGTEPKRFRFHSPT